MTTTDKSKRKVKGVNLIGLIKTLKVYRRKNSSVVLSPAAEALFKERILPNQWYSHNTFMELIDFTYKNLLASNKEHALQMGIAGGHIVFKDYHGAFIDEGDPAASLLSLRHIWQAYFNFGKHNTKLIDDHTVHFVVTDYPDITIAHAHMIIGWGIATAQLAGAIDVTYELLECPWDNDKELKYGIRF